MRKFLGVVGVLSIALMLVLGFSYGQAKKNGQVVIQKKPADDPVPNPNPGKNLVAATPNLSFPVVMTDIIEIFYQKVWIDENIDGFCDEKEWVLGYDSTGDGTIDNVAGDGVPVPILVEESISDTYDGTYEGNDTFWYTTYIVDETTGCAADTLTQTWEDLNGDGILTLDEYVKVENLPDGSPDYTDPVPMYDWLVSNQPWYDQPVNMDATATETVTTFDGLTTDTIYSNENPNNIWNIAYIDGTEIGGVNSWQADWVMLEDDDNDSFTPVVNVDFIDWGNPLENTVAPIVSQRFPVEMALYDYLDTPMIAYKMACLDYPSTRDEVFGTSTLDGTGHTKEVAFATVLTSKFTAEVWDPAGGITQIPIEPGIGPSGKMNFASAGGGWIPTMPGWHRIWIHFNDPLLSLSGAIVNNDEHYILSTGCMAEDLNKNKQKLVGIIGDSTYVDVYVNLPSGGGKKKK